MTPAVIVALAFTAFLLLWAAIWLGVWTAAILAGITLLGSCACGCVWLVVTELRLRHRVRQIWARGGDRIELARADLVRDKRRPPAP